MESPKNIPILDKPPPIPPLPSVIIKQKEVELDDKSNVINRNSTQSSKSNKGHSSSLISGLKQRISKKLEETAVNFQQSHPDSTFGAKLDQISKHLSASVHVDEGNQQKQQMENANFPNSYQSSSSANNNNNDVDEHQKKSLPLQLQSHHPLTPTKKETPTKYSFTASYNKSQDKIVSSKLVKEQQDDITEPVLTKITTLPSLQEHQQQTQKTAKQGPVIVPKKCVLTKREPAMNLVKSVPARPISPLTFFEETSRHANKMSPNEEEICSSPIGNKRKVDAAHCQCMFWHGLLLPFGLEGVCSTTYRWTGKVWAGAGGNVKNYTICTLTILLLALFFKNQRGDPSIASSYSTATSNFGPFFRVTECFLLVSFLSGVVITISIIYFYGRTFGTSCPADENNSNVRHRTNTKRYYDVVPDYTGIELSSKPCAAIAKLELSHTCRKLSRTQDDIATAVVAEKADDVTVVEVGDKSSRSHSPITLPNNLCRDDSSINYKTYGDALKSSRNENATRFSDRRNRSTFRLQSHQVWMNELPFKYDFETYRVQLTRTVLLKLDGSILKISTPKQKLPKRHLWNEKENLPSHMQFMNHRIYDLTGSLIYLLPGDMPKKVYWNKKYPICLKLKALPLNLYTFNQRYSSVKQPPNKYPPEMVAGKGVKSTDSSYPHTHHIHPIAPVDKTSCFDPEKENFTAETTPIELYIFARANREKEEWFWKLLRAAAVEATDTSSETTRKANSLAMKYHQFNSTTRSTGNLPFHGLDARSSTAYWIKDDSYLLPPKPTNLNPRDEETGGAEGRANQPFASAGHKKLRTSRSSSPLSHESSYSDKNEKSRRKVTPPPNGTDTTLHFKDPSLGLSGPLNPKVTVDPLLPPLRPPDISNKQTIFSSKQTTNKGIFFDPNLYVDSQNLRAFLSPLIFGPIGKPPPRKLKWSDKFRGISHSKKGGCPKSPDKTVTTSSKSTSHLNHPPTATTAIINGGVAPLNVTIALPLAAKSDTATNLKSHKLISLGKDKKSTTSNIKILPQTAEDDKKIDKKADKKGVKRASKPESPSSSDEYSSEGESWSEDDQNMPVTDLHNFDCMLHMHPELCWLNAFMERLTYDVFNRHFLDSKIELKIKRKLTKVKLPYFIEPLKLINFSTGPLLPTIHLSTRPWADERGIWWEFLVFYDAAASMSENTGGNINSGKTTTSTAVNATNLQTHTTTTAGSDKVTAPTTADTNANSSLPLGPYITLGTKINLMKFKEKLPKNNFDQDDLVLAQSLLDDNPELMKKIARYPRLFKKRKTWSVKGSESEDTPESSTEEDEPQQNRKQDLVDWDIALVDNAIITKKTSTTTSHHHNEKKVQQQHLPNVPYSSLESPVKKIQENTIPSTATTQQFQKYSSSPPPSPSEPQSEMTTENGGEVTDPDFVQKVVNPQENRGKKILKIVDKIANSKYFQQATDMKYIKKGMEAVSNTPIILTAELLKLEGIVLFNIPNPPSDRLWYGFRPKPDLKVTAKPKLGAKYVNISHLVDWIQNTLLSEFEKLLVVPNMDDIVIPVMNSGQILSNNNHSI